MSSPPLAREGSHLSQMKEDGRARAAQGTLNAPPSRRSCFSGHGVSHAAHVAEVEIYYGTMFGSAERYARALAHVISTQRRARVVVHDLDAFDEATFARPDRLVSSRLFLFVVSTHFAGAPSPSAERFRDWINDLVANPRVAGESKAAENDKSATRTSTQAAMALNTGPRSLWPFRKRREPLRGMQYAVFGVGDSVYLTYNAMGKFVDLKLKELGAVRFHPLGLGDSSNDVEGTLKLWQTALLAKLPTAATQAMSTALTAEKKLNLVAPLPDDQSTEAVVDDGNERPQGTASATQLHVVDNFGRAVSLDFHCRVVPEDEVVASQLYTLMPVSAEAQAVAVDAQASLAPPLGPRTPRIALFDRTSFGDIEAVEIRPGYGGDPGSRRAATFCVRLLNPDTTYISVSTLAIFPQNSHDYVSRLADAFGFDLDAVVQLAPPSHDDDDGQSQQLQLPFPTPCTVRTALTDFLELRTVTREFIRAAAGFVVTSDERAMLERLGSNDGTTDFRRQILEPYKGILELVEMAPTLQIPLEVFLNITPPIKPRFYSIASSPRVSPREVEIAISLGVAGEPHGLTTSYFERILAMPPSSRVSFRGFVSWSRFQFPDDGVSPMVLIAMGVGLSAMRSIVQERLARWIQMQKTSSMSSEKGTATRTGNRTLPATMPTLLLFLGATSKEHVVFSNDLNHWEQQMMVKVHYAFSNDPRHARRRVYDAVASRMDEIVDAIKSSNSSRMFVCGRTNLVHRIREMFETDQVRRGSRWFDAVQTSGRYIDEGFN